MKKSRQLFILFLLILVVIAETAFVGCGGSGDSNSYEEATTVSKEAKSKQNGTFALPLLSTSVSTVSVEAQKENTIAPNVDITLSARAATERKIGAFNNYNTQIYKLTAVSYNSGSISNKTEIKTVKEPITMTINQKFPRNASDFYMATRSSSNANWQFTKLAKEFTYLYSNNNATNGDYSSSSRLAVTTDEVNFTFSITTYHLGEEITIVYDSTGATGTLATGTPSINSVVRMTFATDLPYLDLKFNEAGEYVYNTDLIFTTCIEASSLGSLFSGATAKTLVTFLTDSGTIIDSLQIVGNTTRFADQTVSSTRNGAGDKYTHTILFEDYPNPSRSGRLATYTFTLKLRDVLLSEFPEKFLVKTTFTDTTPITYTAEANLTNEMLLSYLKPVSPVMNDGEVSIGSNLVMKYIAHDIASVTVKYTYPGLNDSIEMTGTFDKDEANNTLTFYPAIPWPSKQTITASASACCCTPHGLNGVSSCLFEFKTGETGSGTIIIGTDTYDPVTVSMQSPFPTDDVDPATNIVLEFSDDIAWEDSYTSVLKLASGTHPMMVATPTFDAAARTITFRPIDNLRYNASYTLIFEGLTDPVNKKYISLCDFAFGTGVGVHGTASIVASDSSIVDGQLIAKPTFIIDFDKDICKSDYINQNKLEYAFEAIKVYKGTNIVPIGNLEKHWIDLYHTMELTFKVPLEASATYHITMDDDVLDFENVTITPFDPYYFGILPEITAELVIPASPIDVDVNTNFGIQFSHPITWISTYSRSINLFNGRAEIPTHNYVYASDTSTVTFEPEEPLLYNASYSILIAPGLYNVATMQNIASNAFHFATCDTAHLTASVKLLDSSIMADGKTIIIPTIEVDFGERVINDNIAKAAVRLRKKSSSALISITPYAEWKSEPTDTATSTHQILRLTYTLEPDTDYVVSMDEGVRIHDGRFTDPFAELEFTTSGDITANLTTPDSSPVADPPANLVLTFSGDIAWSNSEEDRKTFYLERGRQSITSNIKSFVYATDTRTLTINVTEPLHYNASYTIGIDDGLINSITGQKIATCSFYFEVSDAPHKQAEISFDVSDTISTEDCASLLPKVLIKFNESVMSTSEAQDSIRLYEKSIPENLIKNFYTCNWNNTHSEIVLKFTPPLKPETEYIITMRSSPKDCKNIPIDPFTDFEFKTMADITASLTVPADLNAAAVNVKPVFEFSNDINWSNASDSSKIVIRLQDSTQELIQKAPVYNTNTKTLTITPKENLLYNATYTIVLKEGLTNSTTGQKVLPVTYDFMTVDGPHAVASISLAATDVVNGEAVLKPTINIDLKNTVLNADLQKVKEAVKVYKGSIDANNEIKTDDTEFRVYKSLTNQSKNMTLTFSGNLDPQINYIVTMDAGIRDEQGLYIDPFENFEFTTQNIIGLKLVSPADPSNAPIDTAIIVQFDSAIDWIDGEKNKFKLMIGDTILGFATDGFVYNSTDHTVTITPAAPLLYNTTYTLEVKKGIKNNTTQQVTEAKTFEFTTTYGDDTSATLIVSEADKINELLSEADVNKGIKDILVVTPTFLVDFGCKVSNPDTALRNIKIYQKKVDYDEYDDITASSEVSKNWLGDGKYQTLKLTFDTKILDSSTIFEIRMVEGATPTTSSTPITPFDNYRFKTTPNGTGTRANPFHIYTAAQLDNIRYKMQCYYILKKDIDIATSTYTSLTNDEVKGWSPIGTTNSSFGNGDKAAGLDGDGHKIIGLSIFRPSATQAVGLFGRTVNAELKNIYFENCQVIGEEATGCLVGMANTSTIERCVTLDSCYIKSSAAYVGGLCGDSYSSTISYCRNSATVESIGASGNYYGTGGIVGWNNYQSRIICCYNNGPVKAVAKHCGGIAGYNSANVNNCGNASETIVMGSTDVGGIVGHNVKNGKVTRCLAFGNIYVSNLGEQNIGGIVGFAEENSIITNNIITQDTILNNKECKSVNKVVYNFEDDSIVISNNNYFDDIRTLKNGMGDTSLWENGECFSSDYWTLEGEGYPIILGLP